MERILLYYPSINIPDGDWLRNSLLYTDKVASIFPFDNIEDSRVDSDTRTLFDAGQYQPISVFNELNHHPLPQYFEQNFINTLESEEFRKIRGNIQSFNRAENRGLDDYDMYINKLSNNLRDYLKNNQLMEYKNYDEVTVEKNSAIIYMSMLADYLASVNKDLVTPSTDELEFEKLAFQLGDEKILTHRIQLDKCLPTPSPDMSIADIIKFKENRKQELLQFRVELDKLEDDIHSAYDQEDMKRKMVQFQEKIEKELLEIKKLLGDSKLKYVLNGFSSLLDFKQAEIVGTIAGLGVAGVGTLAALPFVGLGAGALLLSGTLVSSYRKINRKVEAKSSSYIYYAQKAGLLQ